MMKPDFYRVKGEKGLVRDAKTNAILATDISQKREFQLQQKRMASLDQVESINNRLNQLEKSQQEILSLLKNWINTQEQSNH